MLYIRTTQIIKRCKRIKPFLSVKTIFEDAWENYVEMFGNDLRQVEIEEVGKMLSCKGLKRGYFEYKCDACNTVVTVPFGCNSRLCSCCGKRYADKWADKIAKTTIKGVEYRHLTFSMPDILWPYFWKNMKLYKVAMDAVAKTIQDVFSKVAKKEIVAGIIETLHPFKRDIAFDPHVHAIATYGGFDKSNKFTRLGYYINYDVLHKKWQYYLLTSLSNHVPQQIIDFCFNNYPNGFMAYLRPDKIWGGKKLARYIARYIRHPAIANSRIISYENRIVKFYYDDHKKKRHYVKMRVEQFIASIIQHVPEKNMRLIRYYGAHSRNQIRIMKKHFNQSVIDDYFDFKSGEKMVIYCPNCFERMRFVKYKPPDKSFIDN